MNIKSLVCIAVLALSGCTQNVESTEPPEAAAVKALDALPLPVEPLPSPGPKSDAPVTVVGVFSNRKGDGEHAWGYTVELWKHEGRILGRIFGTNDLQLDDQPPGGLLEDVRYDPETGHISFSAKVSLTSSCDATNSHDFYLFDGTLDAAQMKGVITVKGEGECADCGRKENVVFPRNRRPVFEIEAYKNLEEWTADHGIIPGVRRASW